MVDASEARFSPRLELRLVAHEPAIRAVLLQIRRWLQGKGASCGLVERSELLLAEVLNNVAEHAYHGKAPGWIEVSCALQLSGLHLDVRDWGHALPHSLLLPKADERGALMYSDVRQLPEGGFGWYLIRQLTCDLHSHRDKDKNHLQCLVPLNSRLLSR